MTQPPEHDESIRDLEPEQPEQEPVKEEDADAVKGGRKAGGGQQEFIPVYP